MTIPPTNDTNLRLDYLMAFESLEDMLAMARKGDSHAARAILASIACYLHPESGAELPLELRKYLSNAFYEMASGKDARHALNLIRGGRPNYSRNLKVTVAYIVYQLVNEQNLTVLEASERAAENINQNIKDGRFYELDNRPITSDTTRNWYSEFKEEIDIIYSNAGITENP